MVGYNSLAVFLFSALALALGGGYSIGATMLFVGSAALLWKRPVLALKKADYLLIGTLLLYFIVRSAIVAFHADPGREYDAPLRFLLAVPVLLLLLAYPAKPSSVWAGLAVGAIGGGVFVGWQLLAQGIVRPGGTTNPIQFGNISMLLGILCMSGLGWALTQPRRAAWTVLLLLGSVFGMVGSMLTSSRGGWIAMPVCACVLCLHYANMHGRRYLYAGLLTLAALIAVAYAIPQSTVKARTLASLQEARDFSRAVNTETSLGQRLEMWRNAIVMTPAKPLLGWGKQGFMDQKLALIHQGKVPASIGEYTNVHNEYLDALVKQGVFGLAAVLALFLLPLTLFARRLKSSDRRVHPYALAGVSLGISYMVFGLTTTFLTLNIGVMMLAFLTVILWSGLRAAGRTPAVPL
ncbi:O-antigen ligase [Janthinobacterium sp. CG_23.3]|uniref:O-antigen ligase family protein n=1 Tax=Janthinobacterium sp. CG_23.3 TaxID=3349634 RepID=UPI0038D3FFC4